MRLLQAVWQRLHPEPATAGASATVVNADFARHRALAPLYGLMRQRQLLEVRINQDPAPYLSMILDIDLDGDYLLLDDLFPYDQPRHLQPGDRITLTSNQHGKQLRAEGTVLFLDSDGQAPFLAMQLPSAVQVEQRRRAPRARMDQARPLLGHLRSPLRTPWHVTVNNLSAGGGQIAVLGNVLDQLHRDQLLTDLELVLERELRVQCDFRVKHFRLVRRPYLHTEVGGEFVGLPATQREALRQHLEAVIAREEHAA